MDIFCLGEQFYAKLQPMLVYNNPNFYASSLDDCSPLKLEKGATYPNVKIIGGRYPIYLFEATFLPTSSELFVLSLGDVYQKSCKNAKTIAINSVRVNFRYKSRIHSTKPTLIE